MKHFFKISLLTIFFVTGCMQEEDLDIEVIPSVANITGLSVGVMSEIGLFSEYSLASLDIDNANHTITAQVTTFASLENVFVKVALEPGCTITPLNGSTAFGAFGDFSQGEYEVTAVSGASAIWTVTVEQDPNMPDISCLTNFWSGDGVKVLDGVWPSYSPSTVTTTKIDCNHVTIAFEFWGGSNPEMVLELELGDPDPSTFKGSVTLLNDVSFSSYGYDITYFAGDAGFYDLNTFEINFNAAMTGYGSYTSYPFIISKD